MTMPVERMRSLRWGAQLLDLIQQDGDLEVGIRRRAARLMSSYPQPSDLVALLEAHAMALPAEMGAAIDAARSLFEQIHSSAIGSAKTRHLALYTLRHFPTCEATEMAAASALMGGGLGAWLHLEDPAHWSR